MAAVSSPFSVGSIAKAKRLPHHQDSTHFSNGETGRRHGGDGRPGFHELTAAVPYSLPECPDWLVTLGRETPPADATRRPTRKLEGKSAEAGMILAPDPVVARDPGTADSAYPDKHGYVGKDGGGGPAYLTLDAHIPFGST